MKLDIARLILQNRVKVIATILLVTLFMAYKSKEVKLQYEFKAMLPETDTTYLHYFEFKKLFGEETDMMIIGIKDSNLFELHKFRNLQQTLEKIKSINGVHHIVSIVNTIELIKDTSNIKFETLRIFPDTISTQAELDSAVKKLDNLPLYKKILYNKEKHVYLIAVTLHKEIMQSPEREPMLTQLTDYCDEFAAQNNVEVHYSGLPYTRTMMGLLVKHEMIDTSIFAAIITIVILLLLFRSVRAVVISFTIVIIAIIWSMGLHAIFDYRISVLSSTIPTLLIIIGVSNSIYLISRYHNEFLKHGDKTRALSYIISKVGLAAFLNNLTASVGFAAFMITSNSMMIEFGAITSINIIALFVLSFTLVPIFFSFLADPKPKHTQHLARPILKLVINFITNAVANHRTIVFITATIILVLSINGMRYLHSTGYMLDDIPKDNHLSVDLRFFEENINGVMPFEITIHTHTKKGATRLHNLKKVEELEARLAKYPELTTFLSIADGYKFIHQAFYNNDSSFFTLPDQQELAFMAKYLEKEADKASLLNNMIDSSGQIIRMTGRVKDLGTKSMTLLTHNVKAEADSVFNPEKYDTKITGSSILFTKGTTYLISNLYESIVVAIIMITFFMALLFRSIRMILITIVPNLLSIIITAGVMGYFNIPIKISTALVFSITFGIAVDSAIHILARYRQELHTSNNNLEHSILKALNETAPGIIYTAIILFFGFSVFLLSDFGGTQALGLLIMITLLLAAFANLLILPSIIMALRKYLVKVDFQATEDDIDFE